MPTDFAERYFEDGRSRVLYNPVSLLRTFLTAHASAASGFKTSDDNFFHDLVYCLFSGEIETFGNGFCTLFAIDLPIGVVIIMNVILL